MNARIVPIALIAALALGASTRASATIVSLSSDWCQGCLPSFSQRIVAGKTMSVLVKGAFVDLSTRVEITGTGVQASFGARTGGANSSVEIRFVVDPQAALGSRTVRLRYAIETNGPDTFQVTVVRGGKITGVQRRVAGALPGSTALQALDPVPVGQPVRLVFSGTRLGNAAFAPNVAVSSAHVLPNCSESSCELELTFARAGTTTLDLYDADVGTTPGNTLFHFFYGGAPAVTITGVSAGPPPGIASPPIAAGSASPAAFLDVAPRANMLNVFRRSGNPVSVGGQSFVPVDDSWCAQNAVQTPPTGSASKLMTVPNPVWGITNVGTAQVGAAFLSRLSANGQTLQQTTVAANTLAPGATQNTAFARPRSTVRVVRFGPPNPPGCFVNPNDPNFFEDPPFTVQVDVNGTLPEGAGARANNSRTY